MRKDTYSIKKKKRGARVALTGALVEQRCRPVLRSDASDFRLMQRPYGDYISRTNVRQASIACHCG